MPIPSQLPYILSISDLYLTPVYIFIFFLLIKRLKNKYYSDSPLGVYILPAFFIHVFACIFFAFIFQYFYGYGDIFGYYTGAHETWQAFIKNPKIAFELIFVNRDNFSDIAKEWAPYSAFNGFAPSLSAVVKIAGFVALFCFGSYLPIALVFGLLSFWGTWLIYITINKYFPHLYKYTAIACLFIPSVVIWSSGISKEPPCMFALGLCFYSLDNILHSKKRIKNLIYFIIGAMALLSLKDYIFYTFLIAAFLWIFHSFMLNIKSFLGRIVIKSLVFIVFLAGVIFFISSLQQNFIANLDKGEQLQESMTSINESSGGSGYTLPTLNLSVAGILQSFLLSLNVTLFRPYLWECTNPLMLMSFMESFATFILTIIVLFKGGILKGFSYSKKYPILLFMIMFTLILAPIVGFISFNFGTLVRYKIPFLPFFISFLFILLFDKKVKPKELEIKYTVKADA